MTLAFVLAGALQLILVSIVLFLSTTGRGFRQLSALLFQAATVITAIAVSHETTGDIERAAVAIEHLMSWTIGPTLLTYIRAATGVPTRVRLLTLLFAPGAAIGLAMAPMILVGQVEPLPPLLLVGYGLAFTVAATWQYAQRKEHGGGPTLDNLLPLVVLALLGVVHLSQLVRLIAADLATSIVPIASVSGSIALVAVMLRLAFLKPIRGQGKYSRSAIPDAALQAAFRALVGAAESGLFRAPDLNLRTLSQAAGLSEKVASQALSKVGNTSFSSLLRALRVEEAKRLLSLEENAKVALEPIGMEAGFRSRSVFYAAFTSATGMTPAEFRRRAQVQVNGYSQSRKDGSR